MALTTKGPIVVNGVTVVDENGNIDAPVTTTNLTTSGNTTLGDAAGDVATINGTLITATTTTSSGAGAVAITGTIHEVTTTGADALTLADGTEGQRLAVVMVVDGGDGTLTPSNFGSGTTITFDDAGDTADLLFTNGNWYFMGGTATVA